MNESPQERDRRQLHSMWEGRSTEELLDVWQQNNRSEWRDEAFEVIGQILTARLGAVPPQGEPANRTPPKATHRTKWIALGAALVAVSIVGYLLFLRGNSIGHVHDETQTVTLTRSLDPKYLIYENDIVQIRIGYDQFTNYIESQLIKYEDERFRQEYYREWRDQIDHALTGSDSVKFDNERMVADLVERGQATVFDKRNQSYVTAINRRLYEYYCDPLCGGGLRYFYLPDANLFNPTGTQFLEVEDWVS